MDYPVRKLSIYGKQRKSQEIARAMLLLRLITPSIWRACSQANDGLGNRINFKVNLSSWRYCVGGWLTFWRRRCDPKQGVGTRLHRQISLDCFTILPAMQATLKFDIEQWRVEIQATNSMLHVHCHRLLLLIATFCHCFMQHCLFCNMLLTEQQNQLV